VTTGTAVGVSANIVTRTTVRGEVTRSAIVHNIARTAIGEAITIQAKTAEQVAERCESGCAAIIDDSARVAIYDNVARIAVVVTVIACLSGKQVTQASAYSKPGEVADFVARIARECCFVTRIAGENGLAGIAVVGTNAVDQSLETRKQVAASYHASVTCSARIGAGKTTRIRKTLNTHH